MATSGVGGRRKHQHAVMDCLAPNDGSGEEVSLKNFNQICALDFFILDEENSKVSIFIDLGIAHVLAPLDFASISVGYLNRTSDGSSSTKQAPWSQGDAKRLTMMHFKYGSNMW